MTDEDIRATEARIARIESALRGPTAQSLRLRANLAIVRAQRLPEGSVERAEAMSECHRLLVEADRAHDVAMAELVDLDLRREAKWPVVDDILAQLTDRALRRVRFGAK
ncbi:MAG: hypothetical protein H6721_02155 [Sandaracinus sp.]|nr:hypothetical protein [Myxococcales bacterium]MCB9611060.1 hypothetical protein [Sandaracinus sp.]MCB9630941.1 hypothetical protein [Sandaracinus sp.]